MRRVPSQQVGSLGESPGLCRDHSETGPSWGAGSRHQHSPRESPGPAAGHPKKETKFHTTSFETEIETKIGPSEEAPSAQCPRDSPAPPLCLPRLPPRLPFPFLSIRAPSRSLTSRFLFLAVIARSFYTFLERRSLSISPTIREAERRQEEERAPEKEGHREKERGRNPRGTNGDRDREVRRAEPERQATIFTDASVTTALPPSHLLSRQARGLCLETPPFHSPAAAPAEMQAPVTCEPS